MDAQEFNGALTSFVKETISVLRRGTQFKDYAPTVQVVSNDEVGLYVVTGNVSGSMSELVRAFAEFARNLTKEERWKHPDCAFVASVMQGGLLAIWGATADLHTNGALIENGSDGFSFQEFGFPSNEQWLEDGVNPAVGFMKGAQGVEDHPSSPPPAPK